MGQSAPHNHSGRPNGSASRPRPDRGYSSSNGASPPFDKPKRGGNHRKNSNISQRERELAAQQGKLLVEQISGSTSDDDEDAADLDLPPATETKTFTANHGQC